jgi:hypothetical protein
MKRYIKSTILGVSPDSELYLGKWLKNGDTPRKLPKDGRYLIQKWGTDGLVGDYGELGYADTVATLRGFHYEELFPGEGMWAKPGIRYMYSVERVR